MARQKPSRRPKTELEKQFDKLYRNLTRRVRNAEGRGFIFPETILKKPKKITAASIRRIENLKGENLYKRAKYNGELNASDKPVSGTKGRQFERKAAAAKAAETRKQKDRVNKDPGFFADNVINNYKDELNKTYTSTKGREIVGIMNNWLNEIIAEHGKYNTAVMLNDGAANGWLFTQDVAYTEEKRNQYMAEMLNYLPGGDKPERRQQISDAMEVDEDGFIIAGDMEGLFS